MSVDMNPQKSLTSLNRASTIMNKNSSIKASFSEKLKQVKAIISTMLPEDKKREVLVHLEELHQIYLAESHCEKGANNEQHAVSKKIYERESGKGKEAKSEKVILEFREGNKLINQVKIEAQNKFKSPQRKVEEKRFIKFQPKKVNKAETSPGLANIFKNGGGV